MTKKFKQNIEYILRNCNITKKDLELINQEAYKQLKNNKPIDKIFEKFIVKLLKKYDLQYMQIYALNTEIWLEIIGYKFNNIKEVSKLKFL